MRPILLLALWQVKNAVRSSFTDLRKLIPLLFFVFAVGVQALNLFLLGLIHPAAPPEAGSFVREHLEAIRAGLFFCLALVSLGCLEYGFTEGFLTFPLADVDYLFPAPIPRKVVLAYRLAGKTGTAMLQGVVLFWVMVLLPAAALAPRAGPAGVGAAMGALFFCLAGYTNVALALKLVFGFGRLTTVRRWLLLLVIAAVLLLGITFYREGLPGLAALARSGIPTVLFYPCRLAADALALTLVSRAGVAACGQLLLFYLLTLALVFSRNENFYEASLERSERTARLLQAAREQNWGAIFALRTERRRSHPDRGRPYTVPPFGRGAGALFWAHVAAAAKRPVINGAAPLLGGAGFSLAVSFWLPAQAASPLVLGVSAYLLFLMAVSGLPVFRQALQRQTLVRPLPVPAWQVVAAEVAPRVLILSLFGWGAGFPLLLTGVPLAPLAAVLLIPCAPALIACLNLVQYGAALWFPDAQDKLQQLLGGVASLFLTGLVIGVLIPFLLVPLLLGAPFWAIGLSFFLACAGGAALLLFLVSLLYRRHESRG